MLFLLDLMTHHYKFCLLSKLNAAHNCNITYYQTHYVVTLSASSLEFQRAASLAGSSFNCNPKRIVKATKVQSHTIKSTNICS